MVEGCETGVAHQAPDGGEEVSSPRVLAAYKALEQALLDRHGAEQNLADARKELERARFAVEHWTLTLAEFPEREERLRREVREAKIAAIRARNDESRKEAERYVAKRSRLERLREQVAAAEAELRRAERERLEG